MPLSGEPFTENLPPGQLDVLVGRLELVGDDPPRLLGDLGRRAGHGLAADRGRARAVGAEPLRAGPGVAVDDLDVLRAVPSRSATICAIVVSSPCPCGEVPVNTVTAPVMCTRTIADSHRPVCRPKPGRPGDARRRQAADLGVGGVADPAQLALGRLRLDGVGVEVLEQQVQRPLVVAGVVDDAERHRRAGSCPRR